MKTINLFFDDIFKQISIKRLGYKSKENPLIDNYPYIRTQDTIFIEIETYVDFLTKSFGGIVESKGVHYVF